MYMLLIKVRLRTSAFTLMLVEMQVTTGVLQGGFDFTKILYPLYFINIKDLESS